jgi:hypothetical protein
MKPHQQRVVDEKAELDSKLAKLMDFYNSPIYGSLDEAERVRLSKQGQLMAKYSDILGERIAAFT